MKKQTFEDYISRLRSGDKKLATQAARDLGDQGDVRAVPHLIDLLVRADDPVVRNAAAVGLRELRDSRAVPHIIKLLADPKTEGYRGTLLYALQEMDSSRYLPLLVELVISGGWEVSHEAFVAIESSLSGAGDQDQEACIQKLKNALPEASGYKVELLKELLEMFEGQEA